MRRRQIVGSAAAAVLTAAISSPAYAEEQWCDIDPPVVLTNGNGDSRVVYVSNGGPLSVVPGHFNDYALPTITQKVKQGRRSTEARVQLDVTVADTDGHRHPVISEVWTEPARTGTLLSRLQDVTGDTFRHRFEIEIP